ncbi:hypothetical protein H8959_011200, partial [Pygathrix nigripes]
MRCAGGTVRFQTVRSVLGARKGNYAAKVTGDRAALTGPLGAEGRAGSSGAAGCVRAGLRVGVAVLWVTQWRGRRPQGPAQVRKGYCSCASVPGQQGDESSLRPGRRAAALVAAPGARTEV